MIKVSIWSGDLRKIADFYKSVDYKYEPKETEIVVVATDDDKKIIGVVRLSEEQGILHLRGMQIEQNKRDVGVGTEILKFLDKLIGDKTCYLVGYPHLINFYGKIGFKELDPKYAPKEILARLENAARRFPDTKFNIMRRTKSGIN